MPGDSRAWQLARSFGDSAEKCKGADLAARGTTIFVVPRRGRSQNHRFRSGGVVSHGNPPRALGGGQSLLCSSPSMPLTILKFATPLRRARGCLHNSDARLRFVVSCKKSSPGDCENRILDWRHPKHGASISGCICQQSSAQTPVLKTASPH